MTYTERTVYSPLSMKDWQYRSAFVIQFHPKTKPEDGQLEGRVEHVASTRAVRFHSLDELLAFIASVLNDVRNAERS